MRLRPARPLALIVGASLALTAPMAASAQAPPTVPDDPLTQTIDAGQQVATGPAELSMGHVDIGPRLDGDDWTLMVHDDGVVPPVWRSLDDAVIRVNDSALLTVPDDPTYDFLGVEPGTAVHVVPQVQNPDAVWVGWNTQEPNVMAAIDRGVTLTLLGAQGPGALTVFLQAGNLSAPDVLWTSAEPAAQPLWVEVNTHTHANWVFSEPGEYLVEVEASADLIDGRQTADVATLRFAIGDAADADAARQATFTETPAAAAATTAASSPAATAATSDDDTGGGDGGGDGGVLVAVVIVAAILLAAGATVAVVRGRRAKQRAETERMAARRRDGGQP